MLVRTAAAAAGAQGAVKVGKPEVAASAAALPCVSSVPAAFRVMVVPVGSFRPGLVFCTYSSCKLIGPMTSAVARGRDGMARNALE
jgi:hypothetical protein